MKKSAFVLSGLFVFLVVYFIWFKFSASQNKSPQNNIPHTNVCATDVDCLVIPAPQQDNKCCNTCDVIAMNNEEFSTLDLWRSQNCQNVSAQCTVHDCYAEKIPVAKCIASQCQVQWSDR